MKFWQKIPGFRSGKRWKMGLAVLAYICIILIFAAAVVASSYSDNSPVSTTLKPAGEPSGNALIVYYSLSSKRGDGNYSDVYDGGYCEQTAYAIAHGLVSKNWEVTLLRVEPTDGNILHMLKSCGGHAVDIKPVNLNASGYDLVVIGSPIWNNGPVAAIMSYLDQVSNLKGKKVALFITAGGYSSLNSTEDKIKKHGANITDTLTLFSRQKAEAEKLAEEFGEKLGS
ncbi:flavodoxin family protein [Methanobacterium sp.]|uniref:flavodoxin family protein n=1 Tax=Methanobacterium sp. TaxID=2164 RepID=UPI003C7855AA